MTTIYFIKYWDTGIVDERNDFRVTEFFYSRQDAMQRVIEVNELMEQNNRCDCDSSNGLKIFEMKILVGRAKQKTIHSLIEELNKLNFIPS